MASTRVKVSKAPIRIAGRKSQSTSAPRIFWLAGLGLVALIRREGEKRISGLADDGRMLESRTRTFVAEVGVDARAQLRGWLMPVSERLQAGCAKTAAAIERGVGRMLGRLGVPSKADVDELTRGVAALSRQLRTMR